jgi:hypothetical protein
VVGGTSVLVWRVVDRYLSEKRESRAANPGYKEHEHERVATEWCMWALGLTFEEVGAAQRYAADHWDEIHRDLVANLPDRWR